MISIVDLVLVGPTSRAVRVRVTGDAEEKWVISDGTPGVTVLELPFEKIGKKGAEGIVHIRVEGGYRYVFTSSTFPWTVGSGTDEHKQAVRIGAAIGAQNACARARDAAEKEGWIENEAGERALSVRPSDVCSEKHTEFWTRFNCGHVYCKHCDGHVDPNTSCDQRTRCSNKV